LEQTSLEGLSDEQLVRLTRSDLASSQGRRAAEALLMRWRERLYLWCFRLVRDRERALDLTQECLIRAYRGLPSFGERAAFSSWLFAIARNRCLSALRERPLRHDPDIDVGGLTALQCGPEETAEHRVDLERVMRTMEDALAPLERQALWLRAYEGMQVEEITRLLGLDGPSGARGLLQRARRKLRAALGESIEEEER
jgi:RNA polymerase sigma-70 factor, ECF subfamily